MLTLFQTIIMAAAAMVLGLIVATGALLPRVFEAEERADNAERELADWRRLWKAMLEEREASK